MNALRISVHAPVDHVTVTLENMTLSDIQALVHVLDADRNHRARHMLYEELRRARRLIGVFSEETKPVSAVEPAAEPGDGAILSDGPNVFIRMDDPDEDDTEGRWYCTGVERIYRWHEIASRPRLWRMVAAKGES